MVSTRAHRVALTHRSAVGIAVAAAVVVFVPYFVLGTGFVLDDWFTLRNAHFDGVWSTAGSAQEMARPGAAVVYALTFGLIGQHPLPLLALGLALTAACAVLIVRVVSRFAGLPVGLAVALLWLLAPNHTSLEAWASALNISVALLLSLLAFDLISGGDRDRSVPAALLALAATLTYEAVAPLLVAGFLVLPWLRRGRPDWKVLGRGTAAVAVGGLWIVTHWHPDKHVAHQVAAVQQVFPALFGWGVAPGGLARLFLAMALAGVVVAVARLGLPSFRPHAGLGDRLVVAGVALAALGAIPFLLYFYQPSGAGDRVLVVSALGGALTWVGLLLMAWTARRELAVALAVASVLAMGAMRWDRARAWSDSAKDSTRILRLVRETYAAPGHGEQIDIAPYPKVRDNTTAFIDPSNIASAVQLTYDDRSLSATLSSAPLPHDLSVDISALTSGNSEASRP